MEVRCPACGVVPKNHTLPTIEIPKDTQVKSPRTNEMMTFTDAIIDYIRHYFPHLHETTYRVPSALFYESRGDLDLYTNEDITQNCSGEEKTRSTRKSPSEVIIDRFQKDAVEKVVAALYAWGIARGAVMFILSEYKLSSYCKLVKNTKSKKVPGEHDLLIFSPMSGVILVEVKSVPSAGAIRTKRKNVRGAWEQVLRNENSFRDMNANLEFVHDLPVCHLMAFPNLTEVDLQMVNVCDLHRKHIIHKHTLETVDTFDTFLSSFLDNDRTSLHTTILTDSHYQELCARYAGFASIVHVRTVADAVRKSAAKMARIFLTPQQLALLAAPTPERLILTGEYGTGKSLILKKLAEQLTSADPSYDVYVVSCSNVSHTRTMGRLRKSNNHLVDHIKQLIDDTNGNIHVCSLAELVRGCFPHEDPYTKRLSPRLIVDIGLARSKARPDTRLAILLDEVPFVPTWDWGPLEEFCQTHPEIIMWMTIGTGTYYVSEKTDNPSSVVSNHAPRGFPVTHLTRCMRMTRNGLRFYKALQQFLGDKAHMHMEYGNAIDGPIPGWFELPQCLCNPVDPFHCSCVESRMGKALRSMWNHLGKVNPSHVSFVVRDSVQSTNKFLTSLVVNACGQTGIPLKPYLPSASKDAGGFPLAHEPNPSEDRSACNLVDIFSFKGCESPVVVVVTPFGWPLVWEHRGGRHGWDDISPQISRALSQIILITWPPDEMDFFSLQAVRGTIDSYSYMPETSSEDEREFARVMTKKLNKVIDTYHRRSATGSLLDDLVKQRVLVKHPIVESDQTTMESSIGKG